MVSHSIHHVILIFDGGELSYERTRALGKRLHRYGTNCRVTLDVSSVQRASVAAFAWLIEVRGRLLGHGGDLYLRGLQGQAAAVHQIHRLEGALPTVAATSGAEASRAMAAGAA